MNIDDFKKLLKDGRYQNAASASKALGRSSMTEEDKTAAKAAIARKFKVEKTAEKAPAAKASAKAGAKAGINLPVAKAAAKVEKVVKRGPGRPPKTDKKAVAPAAPVKRGPGRPKKTVEAATKSAPTASAPAKRRGRPPKQKSASSEATAV